MTHTKRSLYPHAVQHDRHSRGKHQKEAGPLEEPMLDYRAEEELQAQLDDGDDPIAKLQDGEDGSESPYTKALAEDPMVMQNKAQVASDMDAVTKIPSDASASSGSQSG